MKFLKFLDARSFGLRTAERRFEILKFLGARSFGLRTATTEFLNFTPAPPRNGFRNLKFTSKLSGESEILKFTPKLRNRFEILKFTLASLRLADAAQNFISQNGFKILKLVCEPPHVLRPVLTRALRRALSRANKVEIEAGRGCSIIEKQRAAKLTYAGGYLNSARRYIARFCSASVRHGYEVGREEKFNKFSLTNALLNFISLPPCKFKLALLKFTREVPRNGFRILKFVPELNDGSEILNFTPELRKFKPASAMRLNFALNSVLRARAAKFENGVKFKGAAKFKRSVR